MNIQSVVEQPLSPGIISIDSAGQVFTHKLRHTPLSPADNAIVLDLASPLYNPGATIDGVSKVYDRSGKGNHGTITGATWAQTGQGLWYLDFDGTDDVVNVGDILALELQAFSIQFWMKNDRMQDDAIIGYSKIGAGFTNLGWYFRSDDPGDIVQIRVGSGAANSVVQYVGQAEGVWVHWRGTWDGTTLTLYRNDVSVGTPTTPGYASLDYTDTSFRMGTVGNLFPFKGGLALVKYSSNSATPSSYQQERHLAGV